MPKPPFDAAGPRNRSRVSTFCVWSIFNEDHANMPVGASFNVLVFNNTSAPVAPQGASAAAHE